MRPLSPRPLLTLLLSLHLLPPVAPRPALDRSGCCFPPGLTFDTCAAERPCASGRTCLTDDTLYPCSFSRSCICYPQRIERCSSASQCAVGESCAARPYDHFPFCVSEIVVSLDPSFVIIDACCNTSFPIQPPPVVSQPSPEERPPTVDDRPPVVSDPKPTTRPTPSSTPTAKPSEPVRPTPTREVAVPSTPRASSTPSVSPTPSPRPTRTVAVAVTPDATRRPDPTRRPSPTPSRSRRPRASPRPTPSPRPQITAVQPESRPTPTPTREGERPQRTRPPKPSGGLAGDPCRRRGECLGYRKCVDRETKRDCGGGDCVCVGSRLCVCSDQCTDGEVCSGSPGRAYCFSPRLIESLSYANPLPCPMTRPTPTPVETREPRPTTTGRTGESCRIDKNCEGERKCTAARSSNCVSSGVVCDGRQQACTVGDRVCYCYQLQQCNCSLDCDDDEVCTSTLFGRICLSPLLTDKDAVLQTIGCPSDTSGATAEDPILIVNLVAPENLDAEGAGASSEVAAEEQDAEDEVCVDAQALSHLPVHELVYKTHRTAYVLCDAQQSCATPGHVVVFNGRAMMMKTYCEFMSCENRIMQVNSPRLKPSVRIPSKTDGLQFTAFAARYQTRVEELALTTIVHVGL
ncbi:hypothetical protein FGB62_3g363 [Gracilaria domingensis]|nr:hypothetical protein FGB62_3g363 [Gracilaria domingensis]